MKYCDVVFQATTVKERKFLSCYELMLFCVINLLCFKIPGVYFIRKLNVECIPFRYKRILPCTLGFPL